jgi:2-furoyl-CoA dehydrogenase large subunit
VRLTEEGGATRVAYDYRIEIGGKVASIGGRMLEGAAKMVVGQFFARLCAQIEGKEVPAEAQPGLWHRLLVILGFK